MTLTPEQEREARERVLEGAGFGPDPLPRPYLLLASAESAGLFRAAGNRTKMVMPLALPGGGFQTPPANKPQESHTPSGGNGGGGGGSGGDDGAGIDPAIMGLLRRLPPGGTPLSAKRRKSLIEAFTATVGFIYPEADSEE